MAKGIVYSWDNVANPHDIRSAQYGTAALENGQVVGLTALKSNEREIWTAAAPVAGGEIYVVCETPLMYDEKKDVSEFEIAKDTTFRAIRALNNHFEISEDALSFGTAKATDLVAGAAVVGTTAMKLTLKASAANGDKVYGYVREVTTHAGRSYAWIVFDAAVTTVSAG